MPVQVIAQGKIHDGKRSGNNFRFQPSRTPGQRNAKDNQTLFRSLTYVRGTIEGADDGSFMYGAVMGPNRIVSGSGNSAVLDPNSKVIPIIAADESQIVPIRKFFTPEELKKPQHQRVAKSFIDWASFKSQEDGNASLVKYVGNNTVNVEIWTGLFEKMTEEMYQLLMMLQHGSIAHSGGRTVARTRKKLIDPNAPAAEQEAIRGMAKLVLEDHSDVVNNNDVPLWSVRTWEIEFSAKDSEIVLVRHFGAFYVVEVKNAEVLTITMFTGEEAKKWEKRFLRDWAASLKAERTKAEIDAKLVAA